MQKELGDRGFTVIGVPCNQFAGQEPGSSEEIAEFCSATYGVTFPLTEKVDVNGPGRHHLYEALVGGGDDIGWNFEKFLLDDSGEVIKRFAPQVTPEDPELRAAVDAVLAG
jgi:glutathione peroxidase